MLKFNNINITKRCEICSKIIIKTPEQGHWCRSGVFTVDFEPVSNLFEIKDSIKQLWWNVFYYIQLCSILDAEA